MSVLPKNQESLYQCVIDSLSEGILYCDKNLTIRIINSCYANQLGGTVASLIGRSLPDLNPGTRASHVIKQGKAELADMCTLPLFGDACKFIVNRIPIIDASGIVLGMVSHILFTDPLELKRLNKKIESLLKRVEFYKKSIHSILDSHYDFNSIIGNSTAILAVKEMIMQYSREVHPVLVRGKTGTGKELVAHALHAEGNRAEGPFISINCAAIPKELFEAELFGYASGAFSGARKDGKTGQFELANNGTLFLDEIGDMPLHAQAKLLRVLEEKRIMRVGSVRPIQVDFRLISATNRDLKEMVDKGLFREDLYYRLSTLNILLPPLSERVADIIPIAHHVLAQIGCANVDFTTSAIQAMESYSWPGNVRQLFNSLVHASIHCKANTITISDLPSEVCSAVGTLDKLLPTEQNWNLTAFIANQEADFLHRALRDNMGNVAATARKLGISRVTLYEKMKKYAIEKPSSDSSQESKQ